MIDRRALASLFKQLLYISLGIAIIFYRLLPLETIPATWVGPDLLVAATFLYAVRRPAYVPMISVAVLFLFSDLMLHHPPGLMSLFMVLSCEWLKRRSHYLRVATFSVEWLAVAFVIVVQVVGSHIILTLTMATTTPAGLTAMQAVGTILLYPILSRLSHHVFGIHKAPTGEDIITARYQR
ncbi:MAG: rod shape-determining protein MreD [Paracoccaceae bacterium]|nr:rod shape-determining protein MreD [Paracoccaceae bacterium]